MLINEFEKFKENIGGIISVNCFFSTSRNINLAYLFVPSVLTLTDYKPVLFKICADPAVKTAVFADVSGGDDEIDDEQEILFNLNSRFEIHSVDFDSTRQIWEIQLQTTDKGYQNDERQFRSIERGLQHYSPSIYFGRLLLYEMGQIEQAEKYFNILLKSLPPDHPEIADVYNWIGVMHHKRHQFDLASVNYDKAYAIRQERLPTNHPHIASSLHNSANRAEGKKDFDLAIDLYRKALQILVENYKNDHEHKAELTKKIGIMYRKKGDLDRALEYIVQALEMFKRILPSQHPHIAMCLRSIGEVYLGRRDFEKALDYFHQKLEMDEQCLPPDHNYLPGDLELVVKTYKRKGEIDNALRFCQEKLDNQRQSLGMNHPRIVQTLMTMGEAITDQNLGEALRYYEEALSLLEQLTGNNREIFVQCLASLDKLYSKYYGSENALPRFVNALNSFYRILPSDHINIANISKNIARCYQDMDNSTEALHYFEQSLSIYRAHHGLRHKKVRQIEYQINCIKRKLNTT